MGIMVILMLFLHYAPSGPDGNCALSASGPDGNCAVSNAVSHALLHSAYMKIVYVLFLSTIACGQDGSCTVSDAMLNPARMACDTKAFDGVSDGE